MATAKKKAENAPESAPEFQLIVIHPFGNYRKGDMIIVKTEIDAVLSCENKSNVHKVRT